MPVETIVISYLLGVLGKEAESTAIKKIKSLRKSSPKDQETEKALIAVKIAIASFYGKYGDYFGPRKNSFLSLETNIQLMLDRIRLGKGSIDLSRFVLVSDGDYPKVSNEALQFLVDEYEKELKKELTLDNLMAISELIRRAERMEKLLENLVHAPPAVEPSVQKISLSRLPATYSEKLFGRENRLELLDRAWRDEQTNVVTLIAGGGVGKSCLVTHWLNRMSEKKYRDAKRVYGWSFYSQGSKEGSQVSVDDFILKSLQWFGDPEPTLGTAVEKGRRLAGLVKREKTVLILDGIEPMQHPESLGQGLGGKIKDPGEAETG